MKQYINLTHVYNEIRKLEDKLFSSNKTAKKQKGSYYTPRFVVEWMVSVTLMDYLIGDNNKTESRFLNHNEIIKLLEKTIRKPQKAYEILNKLFKVKICDISMGWGVFLLYAFELLYHLTLQCIIQLENTKYSHPFLSKDKKNLRERIVNHIISNNLYGADLSPIAIQLAKLKLYEHALKHLDKNVAKIAYPNFITGNSLIGGLSTRTYVSSKSFFKEYASWLSKIPQIHWQQLFPEVFTSGGFDVIIGNPPYINVKKLPLELRQYCNKFYNTYNPNGDIANVFIERAIQLTKEEGFISLITPRYWIEGHNSNKLRGFLLKNTTIIDIVDFRDNRSIFQQSEGRLGIDTLIVNCQKKKSKINVFNVFLAKSNSKISTLSNRIFTGYRVKQSSLSEKKWIFHKTPIIDYLDNIRDYNLTEHSDFSEYDSICNVGKGCSTGNNAIFTLKKIGKQTYKGYHGELLTLDENEEVETLKLLIKSKNIRRFVFDSENKYWIFLKDKDIENYPQIESYLKNYYEKLVNTQKKYKTKRYYDYAAYRSLSLINHKPKIITPYQSENNRFALVEEGDPQTIYESDVITLVLKTGYSNISWNYLLATLNSSIIFYYISFVNKKIYCLYDFRPRQVSNIPIVASDYTQLFEHLVPLYRRLKYYLLSRQSENIARKCQLLETLINYTIFEQYFEKELSTSLRENLMTLLDNHLIVKKQKHRRNTETMDEICSVVQNLTNNKAVLEDISNIRKNKNIRNIIEVSRKYFTYDFEM